MVSSALLINVSPLFFTSASSINPPAPTKNPCPSGYTSWYQNCYKVVETPATWDDAEAACQQEGGNLASIDMSYDQFIRNMNYTKYHNIWIGLTRDSSFGWAWSDNMPVGFLNWAPGEPSAAFHPGDVAEENCVEMYHDGNWNDNNCLQKRGFACRHRQCKDFLD
uniref:C-type lectin domain-containing protein n=1 Tax=Amphiprion ocellaris TaxID=80972 RepID=A0A3Q1C4T7_AMPOC